ncbi:MAG: nuclear transport factor 2 family protein [Planctomycetota bacterium]
MTKPYAFLDDLTPALDSMVTADVLAFLTEDCLLQAGNFEPVRGKAAIAAAFDNLYSRIKGLRHTIVEDFAGGGRVTYRGSVTYKLKDDTLLTVPFCDVFTIEDDLIAEYLIYIDWSGVFQQDEEQ